MYVLIWYYSICINKFSDTIYSFINDVEKVVNNITKLKRKKKVDGDVDLKIGSTDFIFTTILKIIVWLNYPFSLYIK